MIDSFDDEKRSRERKSAKEQSKSVCGVHGAALCTSILVPTGRPKKQNKKPTDCLAAPPIGQLLSFSSSSSSSPSDVVEGSLEFGVVDSCGLARENTLLNNRARRYKRKTGATAAVNEVWWGWLSSSSSRKLSGEVE